MEGTAIAASPWHKRQVGEKNTVEESRRERSCVEREKWMARGEQGGMTKTSDFKGGTLSVKKRHKRYKIIKRETEDTHNEGKEER